MLLMNDSNIAMEDKSPEQRLTIVCVTDQFQCERIIKAGRVMADLTNTKLSVINVTRHDYKQNPESLEHLFGVSKQNGGMMSVLYSEDPVKTIINYIKQNKALNVLTGLPENQDSILYTIWDKFTHVTFFTVTHDGELKEVTKAYRNAV